MTNNPRYCTLGWIRRAAFTLLVLTVHASAAYALNLADPKVQDSLSQRMKNALPPGWSITKKQFGVIPPDWFSEHEKAGLFIEASEGNNSLQVFFLPLDWIGIHKPTYNVFSSSGRGIRTCDAYKTLTALKAKVSNEYEFMNKFDYQLNQSRRDPSLVNGGFDLAMDIFNGKVDQADKIAQSLIRKHCTTPAEFKEAALSLIVLGVPAKTVCLRAAREVDGPDKDIFLSALGYFGGQDSTGVLCEILADPHQTDHARKYAAMALDSASAKEPDPRIAPALVTALQQVKNEDSLSGIVRALAHERYKPAGPELLNAFNRMTNNYYRLEVAQAIAAVRYQDAVPELKRFQEQFGSSLTKAPSVRMVSISQMPGADPAPGLELAILRLTGDWGKPSESMRLMVLPPKDTVLGQKMELRIYVENIGNSSFLSWNFPHGGLFVDGKEIDLASFWGEGLMYYVRPGDVHCLWFDVSPYIKTPGEHKVEYEVKGARSSPATFVVHAAG